VVVEGIPAHDQQLLARIRVWDEAALGAVYDEHIGLVYGVARRVTGDEQLARDVSHEVFAIV
jgi:DNA-directed RNA polymerase specialized sigma24 family protein